MNDVLPALRAILLADADVAALVGTRIYGERVNEADIGQGPNTQQAIELSLEPSGVGRRFNNLALQQVGVELRCYGPTPYEAREVWRHAHQCLKRAIRSTMDDVIIHSINPDMGPVSIIDPDTEWPVVWELWSVIAAE